jgi:hypothetical protein
VAGYIAFGQPEVDIRVSNKVKYQRGGGNAWAVMQDREISAVCAKWRA